MMLPLLDFYSLGCRDKVLLERRLISEIHRLNKKKKEKKKRRYSTFSTCCVPAAALCPLQVFLTVQVGQASVYTQLVNMWRMSDLAGGNKGNQKYTCVIYGCRVFFPPLSHPFIARKLAQNVGTRVSVQLSTTKTSIGGKRKGTGSETWIWRIFFFFQLERSQGLSTSIGKHFFKSLQKHHTFDSSNEKKYS